MPRRLRSLLLAATIHLTSGCNRLFYYPNPVEQLTPAELGLQYDSFFVDSEGGARLHGWHILAKTDAPRATVLHFHGNADNMSSHVLFFSWMTEASFDLIEFDYRGYGSSSGSPTRAGLVSDGQAVLAWAQEHARTKDLVIVGQSLGGAVAIPAYVRQVPPGVRAIVLDSTFASYRGIAREKLSNFWLTWPLQWPLGFLVSDELSPIDDIKKVKVPLLFVHGQGDPVVPYVCGRELYAAANEPKEFWDIGGYSHTAAFLAKDGQYRERLVAYLCQHLAGRDPDCGKAAR